MFTQSKIKKTCQKARFKTNQPLLILEQTNLCIIFEYFWINFW